MYLCPKPDRGGGGSSKLGRFEAFGLRAVKLVGAPIWSAPGPIGGGYAPTEATLAEVCT